MKPIHAMSALLLALACGSAVRAAPLEEAAPAEGVRTLECNTPRLADSVNIGGEPARYRLSGLQQGKGYEVRVSFPGTNPVRVRLWLEGPDTGSGSGSGSTAGSRQQLLAGRHGHGGGRKLLDAEKIMFATTQEGRVWLDGAGQALSSVNVVFEAEPWGRWQEPQHAPKQLLFDIVLEQSTLGVPHSAVPLLVAAVVLVLLAAAAVPWWASKGVPAVMLWLNSGATAGGPAAVGSQHSRRTPLMAQ